LGHLSKEGDEKCERYQDTVALNLNSWQRRTDLRRFCGWLKSKTSIRPLASGRKIFLYGIILSLFLMTSETVFCSITTDPTAVSSNYRSVDVERLADAIKSAENSKTHPYGILKPYCSEKSESQCRKGCIQTIQKRLRLWDGSGDFITYLQKSYAPLNVKNDPAGLNRNWIKNVTYFYKRGNANV
jgi:hypothetical protein